MRLKGSAKVLEARRRRALQLLESDASLREVARQIGCHASSVMMARSAEDAGRRRLEGWRIAWTTAAIKFATKETASERPSEGPRCIWVADGGVDHSADHTID